MAILDVCKEYLFIGKVPNVWLSAKGTYQNAN